MPHALGNYELTYASGSKKLFVQISRIVKQYLVASCKYQRGRKSVKISEDGGDKGVIERIILAGIAFRVEIECGFGERRINILI